MVHRKIQKHIEIATSDITVVHSMGHKSRTALYGFLKTQFTTVGLSIVNNTADLVRLVAKQPDLVFLGMKYVPGPLPDTKVWISEYLEQHHIQHTGSPKGAIELEQNKPLAKQRVATAGLRTSQYVVVKQGSTFDVENNTLRFPMFVKPSNLGAGKGVDDNSVVHSIDELNAKVASLAADYGTDAIVEQFLSGREYSVAVLKEEHSEELIAMPLELVPAPNVHGDRILSFALKSAALETPVFPVTDAAVRAALIELASSAFMALGARDFGRIDIRMDEAGMPHFLEANLIPCLIRGSGNFPKACLMNAGIDYEPMIMHIVRLGLAHSEMHDDSEADSADAYYPLVAPALA